MSLSDAAHMVRLQRDAERNGVRRTLKFNKTIKTGADLASYIKKSKKVRNEADLLALNPGSAKLPEHISYDDEVQSPPRTLLQPHSSRIAFVRTDPEEGAQTWPNVPVTAVTPDHSKLGTPISLRSQRSSFSSFEQMDFTNSSVGYHQSPSYEEMLEDFDFDEVNLPTTGEVLQRMQHESCFIDAAKGVLSPKPGARAPTANFFGYLSSTPLSVQDQISFPVSNKTDKAAVDHEHLHNSPSNKKNSEQTSAETCSATAFLVRCFYACMCFGQSCEEDVNDELEGRANNAINEAMQILATMIQQRDGKTLSTLSILLVMFPSLGQTELAKRLLRNALKVSKQQISANRALIFTIKWMVAVAESSSHLIEFSTEAFQVMREEISEHFGPTSESALVATYNIAWALLREEHLDNAQKASCLEKAEQILGSLRNQCEKILGLHHLQTIMTTVTLARVYFLQGNSSSAETLTGEMIGRLEKVFQPHHPYLLETLQRQAKFLQDLGKHDEAENILLKVVRERFSVLGPTNPRSQSTLKKLCASMSVRGAPIELSELHRQIKAQCVQYETEMKIQRERQAYQWRSE
jgi:hypothetical protein